MSDPVVPVTPPVPAAAAPAAAVPPVPPAPGAQPPDGATPPDGGAPKPAEPLSPRFAAIAKKERELVTKQEAARRELVAERAKFDEERKAFEAERGKVTAAATAFERARAQAKLDPEGFLKPIFGEAWYDFLTEYRLNGGTASPKELVQLVREQVEGDVTKRLETEAAERKKADEARAAEEQKARAAREAEILAGFKTSLREFGVANAEKFELVNLYDQHDVVFQVIEKHHEKTGKILSNEEAYALTEKHIEEQLAKARTSRKFQGAAATPPAPTPPSAGAPTPPAPAKPTLSNGATAAPSFTGEAQTEQDRIARAMAAMEAATARRSAGS